MTPPETLFLTTIPGAMPQKWLNRFANPGAGRHVQLLPHDEVSQTLFLRPGPAGEEPRGIPQLGYLRWNRTSSWQDLVSADGIDPEDVHLVRLYEEEPVVVVGKDHLLAAWDAAVEGPLPASEVPTEEQLMDPAQFSAPEAEDALQPPEVPGAGERMAIQIVASGAGYTVLPSSVARMFGVKDTVVIPAAEDIHPGWGVGLAWRKAHDSTLIQDFIGVTKGRRPGSSRG